MGTLEAEKLMICGGSVPGGSCRNMNCDAAVTCAFAVSSDAPGCKIYFHDRFAVIGGRLDVLDVVDQRGEGFLVG